MLPCCLPSDPNSLQLSVFVIFASLSERYLSATSSLCVAFLGSSASWLTFHTRSDTNSADSNHADNKSKPKLYKNVYLLKSALLDLEMKRYKSIFLINTSFLCLTLICHTSENSWAKLFVCTPTHLWFGIQSISRGNQIEKGYRGGKTEYIENIDNDITNNEQCHCTEMLVWQLEGGRLRVSSHHGQQYAHKSQISQENEKLLYLCMVMSATRHTTDRRCARDWLWLVSSTEEWSLNLQQ